MESVSKLKAKDVIGTAGGMSSGFGNREYARQCASETIEKYDRDVGDLDFGSDANKRLFRNYLAEYASGNDNMRGYYAAYRRCPLIK